MGFQAAHSGLKNEVAQVADRLGGFPVVATLIHSRDLDRVSTAVYILALQARRQHEWR